MKKLLFLLAIFFTGVSFSQITFSHKNGDWCGLWLDKFHISGYKNVEWRCAVGTQTINVYNINNSLFKAFTVSMSPPYVTAFIGYVSENLFDLDSGMELIVVANDTSKFNVQAVFVMDETGAQLFKRDSAECDPMFTPQGASMNNVFQNAETIYFDGVSTKMRLRMHSANDFETYNLPGTIPCVMCTSGIVSGLSTSGGTIVSEQEARFFPNPASDQLKLKYKLPEGSHYAEMKVYDVQGKLVDEFKITDTFDFIYLPTNYNNGLYLYSLIVDGKTIKTEKIVLNK